MRRESDRSEAGALARLVAADLAALRALVAATGCADPAVTAAMLEGALAVGDRAALEEAVPALLAITATPGLEPATGCELLRALSVLATADIDAAGVLAARHALAGSVRDVLAAGEAPPGSPGHARAIGALAAGRVLDFAADAVAEGVRLVVAAQRRDGTWGDGDGATESAAFVAREALGGPIAAAADAPGEAEAAAVHAARRTLAALGAAQLACGAWTGGVPATIECVRAGLVLVPLLERTAAGPPGADGELATARRSTDRGFAWLLAARADHGWGAVEGGPADAANSAAGLAMLGAYRTFRLAAGRFAAGTGDAADDEGDGASSDARGAGTEVP